MKKSTLYIVGGVVVMLAVVWVGYSYIQNSGKNHAEAAIEFYLDGKFEESLDEILVANKKGYTTTNLDIAHGQVLAELKRYEEARAKYEMVKLNDSSAIAAVDELLAQLP